MKPRSGGLAPDMHCRPGRFSDDHVDHAAATAKSLSSDGGARFEMLRNTRDVVGSSPTAWPPSRLVGAVLTEQRDRWAVATGLWSHSRRHTGSASSLPLVGGWGRSAE